MSFSSSSLNSIPIFSLLSILGFSLLPSVVSPLPLNIDHYAWFEVGMQNITLILRMPILFAILAPLDLPFYLAFSSIEAINGEGIVF
jgi:hypothetical protein